METKHTLGPWRIADDGWCYEADVFENQALVSAAPDLLEAVETLLDCFVNDPLGWMDSSDIAIEKAYDAIHKAKGE